jgi:hypothetical protein
MDRFLSACSGSPEDRERYVSSVLQKQDAETARPSVTLQDAIYALGELNACRWMADDFLEWLTELGVEVTKK